MNVKRTKNYDMFHMLPINREIMPKHVRRMIESIKKLGLHRNIVVIRTRLIDGTLKYYIIDGQHTFEACKALGLDIHYTIIEIETELDIVHAIARFNNTSKSWKTIDYVNAFKMYNPDYMVLFKMSNIYPKLSLKVILIIMGLDPKDAFKLVKNGDFVILSHDYNYDLKNLNKILTKHPLKRETKLLFARVYKDYSYKFIGGEYINNIIASLDNNKNNLNLFTREEFIKYIF